jgi:hypothetical protein
MKSNLVYFTAVAVGAIVCAFTWHADARRRRLRSFHFSRQYFLELLDVGCLSLSAGYAGFLVVVAPHLHNTAGAIFTPATLGVVRWRCHFFGRKEPAKCNCRGQTELYSENGQFS